MPTLHVFEVTLSVNRRRDRGLTLMELLVVISILAILSVIIFSVFHRTKHAAHQAKCISNLYQLSGAFSMYLTDWNGFYPGPGGLTGNFNYWAQTGNGGLTPYLGGRDGGFGTVWCCPLMREWDCPYPTRSYGMNSFLRTPSDVAYPGCVSILTPIRKARIQFPGETILLYEGAQIMIPVPDKKPEYKKLGVYVYRCGDWSEVKGWSYSKLAPGAEFPMHGQMNNYLYCDGHVKSRPPGRHMSNGVDKICWEEAREWFVDKEKYKPRSLSDYLVRQSFFCVSG